jgi:hypothetical protein
MRIVEIPMLALQRLLGMHKLAWVFLAPNLILFGLFAFLPVLLNISYATTGGDNVLLADRPDVGLRNFVTLTDCESFLDPNSCREDKFWRAVWNTMWFVTLQVGFMVGFALLTAIILNRDIRARGFFRAVFFFPVLLSPVVVALIWKWILQREGVLNAFLDWAGPGGLQLAGGRQLGLHMVGLHLGLGAYGLLHADPAGGPAGDPAGCLRGRHDGPRLALARLPQDHPAAPGAHDAGGAGAGADQGRADLRRDLRLHRRRPRHGDDLHHPVHLRGRLRGRPEALRPCCGLTLRSRRNVMVAFVLVIELTLIQLWVEPEERGWLASRDFLTDAPAAQRTAAAGSTGPTGPPTPISRSASS